MRFIYISYHHFHNETHIYGPCWDKESAIKIIKHKVKAQGRKKSDAKEVIRKEVKDEEEEEINNDVVYMLVFDKKDKFVVVEKLTD